jgi:hypothetical protein
MIRLAKEYNSGISLQLKCVENLQLDGLLSFNLALFWAFVLMLENISASGFGRFDNLVFDKRKTPHDRPKQRKF